MPARRERIPIRAEARIELPLRQVDQFAIDVVILLHPMEQRAQHFGRRPVIQGVALRYKNS